MSKIRTINDVRNPRWADYYKTIIDVEVDFDELDEDYVPFTAVENDVEDHGRYIYEQAIAGSYGTIADFIIPEDVEGESAMENLRIMRNDLLAQTDYIESPTKWETLTEEQQTAWETYRQALRDLPQDYPNPVYRYTEESGYTEGEFINVVFPTKPE